MANDNHFLKKLTSSIYAIDCKNGKEFMLPITANKFDVTEYRKSKKKTL